MHIFLSNYWWQKSDIWSQASYRYAIFTIWHTYMMLVTKYQISAINSYWEKCDDKYLGRTEGQTDRGKTVYPLPLRGAGWIHPVCSTCQFFMPGSKLLNGITLYVQIVYFMSGSKNLESTDKLNIQGDYIQKFWTRHKVLTSWTYSVIQYKSFDPDMKYWQIEHNPVYSTCLFFMSGSKLGWNHHVCSTCSVQNFWMESSCMFNLSVLHVWSFEPDMKNRQVEYTGRFHPN
jgi:hypothetical protein